MGLSMTVCPSVFLYTVIKQWEAYSINLISSMFHIKFNTPACSIFSLSFKFCLLHEAASTLQSVYFLGYVLYDLGFKSRQ